MTYTLVGLKDYIDEEINKISKEFALENIVIYNIETNELEKVLEDLNTVSLFGNKLIIAYNFDKSESFDNLEKYLLNQSDNTLILVSEKELDKRKKITKLLKEKTKYKELFNYNLNYFVKEKLEDYKMSIMAINILISNCNNNIKRIENELEKLKMYKVKEKEILPEDVEKLVKKGFDSTIFNLIDAINIKDKDKIFKIYKELLLEGESDEKILYTIANHYRLLLVVSEKSKVLKDDELIKEYKLHPYRLTKLKQQANLISKKDILSMLKGFSEIDIAVKSGKKDISTAIILFFEKL